MAPLLSARIAADGQWRLSASSYRAAQIPPRAAGVRGQALRAALRRRRLAIARAMRLNLQAGHVVSGGSTLTMQLARLSAQR
jgi:penicillin-binding protein 1C